jgi:hypothetical protein
VFATGGPSGSCSLGTHQPHPRSMGAPLRETRARDTRTQSGQTVLFPPQKKVSPLRIPPLPPPSPPSSSGHNPAAGDAACLCGAARRGRQGGKPTPYPRVNQWVLLARRRHQLRGRWPPPPR